MVGSIIRTIEYIKGTDTGNCTAGAASGGTAATSKTALKVLIAALTTWLILTAHAYAADTYTVSGTFDKAAELKGAVTYNIYHVGHFSGSAMILEDRYQTVGARVNYTKADFGEQDKPDEEASEWREAWMSSAATLSDYVKDEDKRGEYTSSDGTFSFSGLENGLYLITGTSQSVEEGSGTTYWSPRPMYAFVLNGDTKVSLKPESGHTERYIVTKAWENDEKVKDLVRPKEVEVEIYFGGTEAADLRDTVTLNDSNNWTYSWEASETEADPSMWHVVEILKDEDAVNYSVGYSYSVYEDAATGQSSRLITITNTYDRYELVLNKKMTDFVDHKGGPSQALVFEITGWAGSEKVLHKYVGMVYGTESDPDQSKRISDIPRGITRITVTEVYTGNYRPLGPAARDAELVATEDGKGEWEVSFENEYDDTTFGGGIINKYSAPGGVFRFDAAIGK